MEEEGVKEYRRHIGRRLMVQLPECTLDGTLVEAAGETLTLERVTWIAGDGGQRRPVDGLVMVERRRMEWLQVL